jgi:hypothetical protein
VSEVNSLRPLIHQFYNGLSTIETTYQTHGNVRSKVCDDVVTPRFRSRIAAGEVINNPAAITEQSRYSPGGGFYNATHDTLDQSHTAIGGSVTDWRAQELAGSHLIDLYAGDPDVVVDEVDHVRFSRASCLRNIDTAPFAFGEDLFELGETIKFLRSPFKPLRSLSRKFNKDVRKRYRRSKVKNAKILGRVVSSTWLEYRFAVTPLVRSAFDLAEAFAWTPKEVPPRLTARGFSSQEESNLEERIYDYGGSATKGFNIETQERADVHSGILYSLDNPVRDWRFTFGLRAKDIPETLWAVCPFSFMVDRVVNISQALAGTVNLLDPSVKILAGWSTQKKTRRVSVTWASESSPGWTSTLQGDTVVDEQFAYFRDPWSPTVSDTLAPPNWRGLVKDVTSILDLVALVHQNFRFPDLK